MLAKLALVLASPIVLVAATPGVGFADGLQITVSAGYDSFTFVNTSSQTAIDIQVTLVTTTGPGIDADASSGGEPFPDVYISGPPVDGGVGGLIFMVPGGPPTNAGIPPGGGYTISFPGWPDGTVFDVEFSYPPPLGQTGPVLALQGSYTTEGYVYATPEPASVLLMGAGLAGLLWRRRRK
jgi:hypothetical protein